MKIRPNLMIILHKCQIVNFAYMSLKYFSIIYYLLVTMLKL